MTLLISRSMRRRIYSPACKPFILEAKPEARAGLRVKDLSNQQPICPSFG